MADKFNRMVNYFMKKQTFIDSGLHVLSISLWTSAPNRTTFWTIGHKVAEFLWLTLLEKVFALCFVATIENPVLANWPSDMIFFSSKRFLLSWTYNEQFGNMNLKSNFWQTRWWKTEEEYWTIASDIWRSINTFFIVKSAQKKSTIEKNRKSQFFMKLKI